MSTPLEKAGTLYPYEGYLKVSINLIPNLKA